MFSIAVASSTEEGPEQATASGRILFHGDLMQRLASTTRAASVRFPDTEWVTTDYLGPHDLIVDAGEEGIAAAVLESKR